MSFHRCITKTTMDRIHSSPYARLTKFFVSVMAKIHIRHGVKNPKDKYKTDEKITMLSIIEKLCGDSEKVPSCREMLDLLHTARAVDESTLLMHQRLAQILICVFRHSLENRFTPVLRRMWLHTPLTVFFSSEEWKNTHIVIPHAHLVHHLGKNATFVKQQPSEEKSVSDDIGMIAQDWLSKTRSRCTSNLLEQLLLNIQHEKLNIATFLASNDVHFPVSRYMTTLVISECKRVVDDLQVSASNFELQSIDVQRKSMDNWTNTNLKTIDPANRMNQNKKLVRLYLAQWGDAFQPITTKLAQHMRMLEIVSPATFKELHDLNRLLIWIKKTARGCQTSKERVVEMIGDTLPWEFLVIVFETVRDAAVTTGSLATADVFRIITFDHVYDKIHKVVSAVSEVTLDESIKKIKVMCESPSIHIEQKKQDAALFIPETNDDISDDVRSATKKMCHTVRTLDCTTAIWEYLTIYFPIESRVLTSPPLDSQNDILKCFECALYVIILNTKK